MKVTGKKKGTLSFEINQNDHTYILDAPESAGGDNSGPSPKGLLLSGLIGCTGIDVAMILEKMRVRYADLEITAEARLTQTDPKVFEQIILSYHVTGNPGDEKKIRRAVSLSMETYCGVSAMLRKNSPVIPRIYLNGTRLE